MTYPNTSLQIPRRSETRLAAIKALYLHDMHIQNTVSLEAKEVCQHILDYYVHDQPEKGVLQPEKHFLSQLIYGTLSNLEHIDHIICTHLGKTWDFTRLNTVMCALLRIAVFELQYNTETSYKIILDEYVSISTFYFDEKGVGLVNGIVDKIAIHCRNIPIELQKKNGTEKTILEMPDHTLHINTPDVET